MVAAVVFIRSLSVKVAPLRDYAGGTSGTAACV
jgi:hypothetical protein